MIKKGLSEIREKIEKYKKREQKSECVCVCEREGKNEGE